MPRIEITVNGVLYAREVPSHRSLADFLRRDLGLTGTKVACGEAECGACTVIVNGRSVDSCVYPVFKASGADVQTIEGVIGSYQDAQSPDELHPLQEAFTEYGATQCGFCTPGFIMQAKSLLDENADPDDAEIATALKDTLCRCTGYASIVGAVKAAAAKMRTGVLPSPGLPDVVDPLTAIGRPLIRPDAVAKVTGSAIFADDLAFAGMLYGATVRSDHAHARITAVHTAEASASPGVVAVLTHKDVPGSERHGLVENDWPVFAGGANAARYVGDPIAVVVATSQDAAKSALAKVAVEYEVLPAVTDPVEARRDDAPVLHPDRPTGNLLKHIKVRHGDVAAGFAKADVIVEQTYRTPRTEHAFMEPECSIAVPAGFDADHTKLTIYVGSQIPYSDRNQIAASLAISEPDVRVRGTVMGGGFGGKEDIAAQIHAALAACITGRPVKILYDRAESMLFHPKRHATQIRVKTGATSDGRIVAVEAELYGDSGAYASLGEKVMTRATTHATGPYAVENAKIDCYAMYTNNAPCGAFRGFGVTQSAFAVESTMDMLAEKLNMDPVELRTKNAMKVGTVTATGQLLRESVGLVECLDTVTEEIQHWHKEYAPDAQTLWESHRRGGKRLAWGIAAGYKNTGLGGGAPDQAEAEVEVFEDGRAAVRTSSAEMGQNLLGVLAACVAEELGLAFEEVDVLVMDTDLTPDGGPTTASRQTFVSGNAARYAARDVAERIRASVAARHGGDASSLTFRDGSVWCGDKAIVTFAQAVDALKTAGEATRVSHRYTAPKTQPLGTGGDMHFAFSFAVHAALVSVDVETGEIAVEKVVAAHDVGRAVNPLSLTGQLEGGIVMGLGNALTEHYIEKDGVPWTRRLGQYKMPNIKMMPEITNYIVEHAASEGPYGAKGVGEISSIPISPAIAVGVRNAVGVRCLALPLDQDALLLAMKSGEETVTTRWGDR